MTFANRAALEATAISLYESQMRTAFQRHFQSSADFGLAAWAMAPPWIGLPPSEREYWRNNALVLIHEPCAGLSGDADLAEGV